MNKPFEEAVFLRKQDSDVKLLENVDVNIHLSCSSSLESSFSEFDNLY